MAQAVQCDGRQRSCELQGEMAGRGAGEGAACVGAAVSIARLLPLDISYKRNGFARSLSCKTNAKPAE